MTNVKLVIVLAALSACGPADERPPVQGRDAAAGVEVGAQTDAATDAALTDAAPSDAPEPGVVRAARVDALSITVHSARRSWLVALEQSCEARDGFPFFSARFPNPTDAGEPCDPVAFVAGDLGLRGPLPDGGVDMWSAAWGCMTLRAQTPATGSLVTSPAYTTVGDGGSVTRINAQFRVTTTGLSGAGLQEYATVTILGCPVRPSP